GERRKEQVDGFARPDRSHGNPGRLDDARERAIGLLTDLQVLLLVDEHQVALLSLIAVAVERGELLLPGSDVVRPLTPIRELLGQDRLLRAERVQLALQSRDLTLEAVSSGVAVVDHRLVDGAILA